MLDLCDRVVIFDPTAPKRITLNTHWTTLRARAMCCADVRSWSPTRTPIRASSTPSVCNRPARGSCRHRTAATRWCRPSASVPTASSRTASCRSSTGSSESLISELARLIRSGRPPVVVAGAAADGDGDPAAPLRDRRRRRSGSLQPFLAPPALRCPICDGRLQYERSHAGGIGARGAEQWDYFSCARCGTFQYRHRTRKLRRVE
jgi:hypothetical protein